MQDQLNLWQEETRRVVSESATCYCNFEDEELYVASLHTATGHGSVLWYSPDGTKLSDKAIVIRRSGESQRG